MAAKIKKGDRVVVLSGRDKGRQGEVLKVLPKEERVVVQGVMQVKRHMKPSMGNPEGGIDLKEAPIAVSKVAHIDPSDGRPTRVGFKTLEDGRKVRFAKRSGEVIDR
jgi:large subunit ribosomal protein L24